MNKLTEQDGQSLNIIDENIATLQTIFPEAFTEGKVDFDVLRQLLGDAVDDGEEKYGLTWFGKKQARQIALTPSLGTLRPYPEESVDWETTQNLFIEGDNLEVLKLLQKSYAGKVKMIYIDPPYNTGKEFIYPDKFQDNLDTYLRYTGQKDDEGTTFSTNTETSGRFHTNWLNMLYPRLKLARNLLRQDGAIFISIDDNEYSNLKELCDEIFGERNFAASFVVKSNPRGSQSTAYAANVHEYILCYVKNSDEQFGFLLPLNEKMLQEYNSEDERGKYRLLGLRLRGGSWRREERPFLFYPIFANPKTGEVSLERSDEFSYKILPIKPSTNEEGTWRWSKEKFKQDKDLLLAKEVSRDNEIVWDVYQKDYLNSADGVQKGTKAKTIWDEKEVNYQNGTTEVKALFNNQDIFDFPKPIFIIERMIDLIDDTSALILDFFAGSGGTGHAVFSKNLARNDSNYKFILVQLPEKTGSKTVAFKAGYKTIADIGKERIRRASTQIKEENPEYDGDLGFKVFKLDSSNIRAWNPDRSNLEQTLLDHKEHLVPGRSEQDVLYELLLKRGIELTVPIEEKTIAGKTVYSIGYGALFACLNETIARSDVEELAHGILAWHKELAPASDTQIVFRDSAFADDIAKTNMAAILEQYGISHVRSL